MTTRQSSERTESVLWFRLTLPLTRSTPGRHLAIRDAEIRKIPAELRPELGIVITEKRRTGL